MTNKLLTYLLVDLKCYLCLNILDITQIVHKHTYIYVPEYYYGYIYLPYFTNIFILMKIFQFLLVGFLPAEKAQTAVIIVISYVHCQKT